MPEDKVLAIFNKAEKDYFESEGRYVANKLINEIGREAFDTYVDYGSGSWMMNYKKHKDTIDAYVKNNYNAHGL